MVCCQVFHPVAHDTLLELSKVTCSPEWPVTFYWAPSSLGTKLHLPGWTTFLTFSGVCWSFLSPSLPNPKEVSGSMSCPLSNTCAKQMISRSSTSSTWLLVWILILYSIIHPIAFMNCFYFLRQAGHKCSPNWRLIRKLIESKVAMVQSCWFCSAKE